MRTNLKIKGNGKIILTSGDISTLYYDEINIKTLSTGNNSLVFLLDEGENVIELGSMTININEIQNQVKEDDFNEIIYLLAKEELYNNNVFGSLDLIDSIGDVGLVVKISNAFTKEEKQEAINSLQLAIKDKEKQFTQGKKLNTLGDVDAYSLVDLFSYLIQQEAYLSANSFKDYGRIGVKSVNKLDNLKITSKEPVAFNNLVFNKNRANISVLFTYKGVAELVDKEKAKETGLSALYLDNNVPTLIYRNYTLIKDGELNVSKLVLLVNKDVLKELKTIPTLAGNGDLVLSETPSVEKQDLIEVEINLKAIPIVSRKYAMNNDFSKMYDAFKDSLVIKSKKKAVNYLLKELLGYNKNTFKMFTEEQIEVLKESGLNSKLEYVGIQDYQAKKESSVDADTYVAKTIEFKMKGYSALPDTKKILAAIEQGKSFKKFTEIAMSETLIELKDEMDQVQTNEDKEKVLRSALKEFDKIDVKLSTFMSMSKLAKIVTGTLWEDLQDNDKSDYIYNDLMIDTKTENIPFN